jgi:cytochrome P450
MNEKTTPDWDPRNPSVLRDQRLAYDEMRERCPVAHSDFLGWSLFRHEDIAGVLADPETYSSLSRHRAVPNGMDEPDHSRYRSVLEPYFTPERMRAFEPVCRQIARELMDALPAGDQIELIGSFIHPFTLKSQCAFVGWPLDIWNDLHGWTHGNQESGLNPDRATGAALAREFANLVSEALRIRRQEAPSAVNDLTASLMKTEVDGKLLTEEDIISLLRNWTAGQGTVSGAIELVVFHLIEHPDLQARLRAKPDLLPAAIAEILRTDGPLVANRRTTTRAVEIGGRTIASGEKLTLMWIAANRDSRVFDDPDEVRLDRDQSESYLFGAGIHDCLGAPLAKLEMRVALEELLSRTKSIALGAHEALRRAVYPSNVLLALPVQIH